MRLPDWVETIRPHQQDAVDESVELFTHGKEVVFMDAPTGSGKTLIGEMIRQELNAKALYVCSSKTLQDQFVGDFPYSRVLKGKTNYPTERASYPDFTAAECTGKRGVGCDWCDGPMTCPYLGARREAAKADVAVYNTTLLLTTMNYGEPKQPYPFIVIDECDVLERELMGFVEFRVGERIVKELGLRTPRKGSHKKTIAEWLLTELVPAVSHKVLRLEEERAQLAMFGDRPDVRKIKQANMLRRLIQEAASVAHGLESDGENWVRDNNDDGLVFKPIQVNTYGPDVLWRHGRRWLLMSASIISPEEMAESLGLEESGLDWGIVRVPMTFDVANRPVMVVPVANMVNREKETAWPEMAKGVKDVLDAHPKDRVLVHAVSYGLAQSLIRDLRELGCTRELVTYDRAWEREGALAKYRAIEAAVMIAPSLDRGVDFKDDDCRVQVIAKVPFPYLGDQQVSARANGKGGDLWYAVQTVRTLTQMTGRGVRNETDWCVTYILDSQFGRNVWSRSKRLFPDWWKEAVEIHPKLEWALDEWKERTGDREADAA